jgi:signal transduction histidine kinase
VSRLPIRARLTAVFALAMVLVLAAAGLFVYLRLSDDLNETVDETLEARAAAFDTLAAEEDPEEAFMQLLTAEGSLDSEGGAGVPALTPGELQRAAREQIVFDRPVPGIEGTARVLAQPAGRGPDGAVVVAGQSLNDRDETLGGLVASFAIGGPIAVLLASLIGYGLATAGLRPVEAMRRRAAEVSLTGDDERLPLPAARDEVRRLGETLNDMLDRLRRAFDRERQFVADASHEMRTPIAVLKTELEGALRTAELRPIVRESLVAAIEECDHLAQLAEDLLVLARSADGQLPVRPERMDAAATLRRVRERFLDRAAQHDRRVDVEAPAGLEVDADPLRLRQALGNLLDNALRHGTGDVVLCARHSDGGVELEVRDRGPGIPEDMRDSAFERFTRGDEARTRGGAGLGLAIVRAIAEAHGGRAELAPESAATVRLWLPDRG